PCLSSMDRPLIQRRPETEDMTSDGLASAVFSASTTRWGARVLLASALAFTAAPAWAQDGGPHWYGVDNGDQARLVYGVPDSDDTSLTFICDKGSAVVSAYLTHPPVRAAVGERLLARLSDGRATVDFPGTVQAQEMDDLLHLKAEVPLDAPLES